MARNQKKLEGYQMGIYMNLFSIVTKNLQKNIFNIKKLVKVKNNTLISLKIFEINKLMNKNLWFNYFYKLKLHRLLKRKDNWIDFKQEITNVVQTLDKTIRLYNQRELNDFSD